MRATLLTTAVLATLALATPAGAASVSFTGNSPTSGTFGNSYTTSSGGVGVRATAWSGSTALSVPEQVYLGTYSSGLGVTNRFEGNGVANNSHVTDNIGSFDFVALTFSRAVTLTGITRNGFSVSGGASTDTDAWISYGELNPAAGVAAQFAGFTSRGFEVAGGSGFGTAAAATTWLVGASRLASDRDDGFKLGAVSFDVVAPVPEPATWLSMILGFGLVGGVMRRRPRVGFAVA
ncbi:PEPxxWA-CTERM sorting domain-containing protein [uncultured Sphingomonas sp.]|uniref:PEPxxWA-CTERM sorting domain-containing protein n=1 Tax=uncultured Sphingomonas sp. TaxID=158754 RepID=UPI0035CC308B